MKPFREGAASSFLKKILSLNKRLLFLSPKLKKLSDETIQTDVGGCSNRDSFFLLQKKQLLKMMRRL